MLWNGCVIHQRYEAEHEEGNFLSNSTNKQQFIIMLSCFLERNCKIYHASGDADVMNVQKAVELARVADTLLVGDDTDILVFGCAIMPAWNHTTYFSNQSQRKPLLNG